MGRISGRDMPDFLFMKRATEAGYGRHQHQQALEHIHAGHITLRDFAFAMPGPDDARFVEMYHDSRPVAVGHAGAPSLRATSRR